MKRVLPDGYYPAILMVLVILGLAGGCVSDTSSSGIQGIANAAASPPAMGLSLSTRTTTPAVSLAGSLQDSGSRCDPQTIISRIPVPVDTSVPIQDPMPGIRYTLSRTESDRTIVLKKGEIVEINLGFAPSLAMRWVVPVSGCGLELVNDGTWYTGGDFWNNTGFYRARYRAVSPGRSTLNGKLVLNPDEAGDLLFNLTVIAE